MKIKCKVCENITSVEEDNLLVHCPYCGECWHKRDTYNILGVKINSQQNKGKQNSSSLIKASSSGKEGSNPSCSVDNMVKK